ncbi:MAG: hypothetical protein WAQ77_17480 [Candidatus Acidiferrum sp.]
MKTTSAIAAFIALASFVATLVGESWQAEVMLLVSTVAPLPLWAVATAVTTLRRDHEMDGHQDTHALLFPHAAFFACCCANAYLWFWAAGKGSHENWAAVFLVVVAVLQAGTLLVFGVVLRFPIRTRRLSKQLFVGLGLYAGAWAAVVAAAFAFA